MTTTNINTGVNSLSAAKAVTEIENGVILYEFDSEAETEAAVIECIEKGVKSNTTGRRSLVIYQPAPAMVEEYAVTYGGEAIATTTNEEEAHEIAKGEAEAERTIINVVRKSDNAVIAVYDFTETPTTPETETAPVFTVEEKGMGGYCDKYNVDAFQMNGVNIAFRFTRWDDASRKYYEIPVSVKNQAAVIAAFPGLDIQEDEPGAVLLRGCDDETAAKVGYYAAVLDGELTETTTDTTNRKSANGLIDFAQFGKELMLHPESNRDYPSAPYYVTNENKFLSNWRKEIDGRGAKEIYLCESWEEAQRVYNYLRKEIDGREYANKYTNITSTRPRLNTARNIYTVRYNDGGNKAYQA